MAEFRELLVGYLEGGCHARVRVSQRTQDPRRVRVAERRKSDGCHERHLFSPGISGSTQLTTLASTCLLWRSARVVPDLFRMAGMWSSCWLYRLAGSRPFRTRPDARFVRISSRALGDEGLWRRCG